MKHELVVLPAGRFVQHHAAEQRKDEAHPFQGFSQTMARRPVAEDDKRNRNQKRGVHLHADAAKLTDLPRPSHVVVLLSL